VDNLSGKCRLAHLSKKTLKYQVSRLVDNFRFCFLQDQFPATTGSVDLFLILLYLWISSLTFVVFPPLFSSAAESF